MASGLNRVRQRVEEAAARVGRDPATITLVAVSKSVADDALLEAYRQGQRDFGENRAEDLAERAARLPGDIRWHFVGRLQGRKVRRVRPLVVLLHSLDRVDLAGYWMKGPGTPPPALVQVNVGGDPAKAGVAPEDTEKLVAAASGLGIEVRGLMTMPPRGDTPEEARPHFRALAEIRSDLADRWPALEELSMGMTDDFEVAVEEGATVLRVGRAIFDPTES